MNLSMASEKLDRKRNYNRYFIFRNKNAVHVMYVISEINYINFFQTQCKECF